MSQIPGKPNDPGHLPAKRQSVRPPRHLVMGAAIAAAALALIFAAIIVMAHDKPVCPVEPASQGQQVDKTCR